MDLRGRLRRTLSGAIHRGWAWAKKAGEITPDTPAGFRFRHLGIGASLAFPQGAIFGEQWIEIGDGTLIGERVSISAGLLPVAGMDLGSEAVVRIGVGCSIGRGTHIVGHQSLEIGDDVFTGPYVYITDQNHSYEDVQLPIGRQWPVNDPVTIGPGSWIGASAIVLPGTHLGPNTVVAGGAVVRGKFDGHCVLAGVPARVVREHHPGAGWRRPGLTVPAPGRRGRLAF